MRKESTDIEGCFELYPPDMKDGRGRFVKPYHRDQFRATGLEFTLKEEYYSVSRANVLRGMHFQLPPMATIKIVTCISGAICDAVVDLRINSPTYLKYFTLELTAEKGNLLFIPEGLAHGFYTLLDESIVLYMCSEVYSEKHDTGIQWNSTGIKWPAEDPVVSEKDNNLIPLEMFETPFEYKG